MPADIAIQADATSQRDAPAAQLPWENSSARRLRNVRWMALVVVLVAIPSWILIDTAWAARRGWIADAPAMPRLVGRAAALLLLGVAAALIVPASRRWMNRRADQMLLGVASGSLALLVGEAIFNAARLAPPFHGRQPGLQLELYPDPFSFPGLSDAARLTYNEWGLRGETLDAGLGVTNVLCLGGSTTEQLYVDDQRTWPAQLARRLNGATPGAYRVANAGHCDYGVAQHARFIRESPLIDQVHVVVLLPGIGDLMRYLLDLDLDDHCPPVWYRSSWASVAREVWNGRLGHGMQVDPTGAAYAHARTKLNFSHWSRLPDFDVAARRYEMRLRELIDQLSRRGKKLLCVTQPALWSGDLSPDGMRRLAVCRMFPHPTPYPFMTPENLRSAIDRYNDAVREVCRDTGTGLVDAAAAMNGDSQYFYDDYHFTEAGSARLAELVAREFYSSRYPD
jgi:lysophospholipase L1-like esterase